MKRIAFLAGLIFGISAQAQSIQSPAEFLGYELGSRFTRHHQVVDYYEAVAEAAPDRVKLEVYGQTNEGRPLMIAQLSTPANMKRLEEILDEPLLLRCHRSFMVNLARVRGCRGNRARLVRKLH